MAVAVNTLLTTAVLLGAAAPALAMGPAAPFTPPARVTSDASSAAAAAAPASSSASSTSSTAADAVGSGPEGLSGLRLAGAGSAALIDGRWWPLGSQPRGARLVAVQRQQVQLRHANGQLEWLALNPAASLTFGVSPSRPQPRIQPDTAKP